MSPVRSFVTLQVSLLLLLALLCQASLNCVSPAPGVHDEPVSAADENATSLSSPGSVIACWQIKGKIEEASAIALKLRETTWDEFAMIGWSSPLPGMCAVTPQGYTYRDSERWTALSHTLPAPATSDPLVVSCSRCLVLANEICGNSLVGGLLKQESISDNATLSGRRKALAVLKDALSAAQYQAVSRGVIVKNAIFVPVERHFDATEEEIAGKYRARFSSKAARFIEMHEQAAATLFEAEQMLTRLGYGDTGR